MCGERCTSPKPSDNREKMTACGKGGLNSLLSTNQASPFLPIGKPLNRTTGNSSTGRRDCREFISRALLLEQRISAGLRRTPARNEPATDRRGSLDPRHDEPSRKQMI